MRDPDAINSQYRLNEIRRIKDLSFVLGYEIHLSNNCNKQCNICSDLSGIYPKDFIWTGWHDSCKCFITSILQEKEDFNEDELNELRAAFKGMEYKRTEPKGLIKVLPMNFIIWYFNNVKEMLAKEQYPDYVMNNIDLITYSIKYYKSLQK